MNSDVKLPLVYSCSGCSSAAQAANTLAVRLDRERHADMSCIVGVAAGIASLVRVAESGRPMLAIDGCPLACCKHALANRGIVPGSYIELSKCGVKKRQHEDISAEQIETLWERTILPAIEELKNAESEVTAP